VELWTHDRARFPLPPRHRFPIAKYSLLRRRVVELGLATPEEIHETEPVEWSLLERVHDGELLRRIRLGELSVREQRGLGLPWSPELVERGRRSVAGTLAAARHALENGVAMNLGGGTHHAGHAFARGYCLFNDVACALAQLRADGLVERALVVDCDVHQGDGTADLLGGDAYAFTLSLHGARNYPFQRIPSDLDVDLPTGTGDADYLEALDHALDEAMDRRAPELAFYLAGADPWEDDRLGRLSLTKAGLRARDELVLDRLRAAGADVCVVLAGGYADDVRDTVEINAATATAVAARHGGEGNRTPTSALQRPRAPVITTPPGGLEG
jgi:acetoin utilization deacetylase AcuC-like enzyme